MTPEAVPDAPADPLRFTLSARIPTDGHLFTQKLMLVLVTNLSNFPGIFEFGILTIPSIIKLLQKSDLDRGKNALADERTSAWAVFYLNKRDTFGRKQAISS